MVYLNVVEGDNEKETAMWCVMVRVGKDWVTAAKGLSDSEAVKLGDYLRGTGKRVRVTIW